MLAPNPTVELLRRARNLIIDPAHWCRGVFWTDVYGDPDVRLNNATRFCALGALWKASGQVEPVYPVPVEILDATTTLICTISDNFIGVDEFNDSHTHEEVLALFDEAIVNALVTA